MHAGVETQETANLDYQTNLSIDRMIENIGSKQSRELLEEALPIIISRKSAILDALAKNDISAAHRSAHRTTGSIRLYGSSSLESLLMEVISTPPNQSLRPGLHDKLESEFDAVIHEIKKRLG